jgi:hypothetical protein
VAILIPQPFVVDERTAARTFLAKRVPCLTFIGLLTLSLTTNNGWADSEYSKSSINDYGGIGLLQTPTARFNEGQFNLSYSSVWPHDRMNVSLQVKPWLETTFRYTAINNQPYSLNPSQSNKDKSGDVKFRLLEEGEWQPAIALGIQDVGGTGLFSSEYVVASKRYYNWDFSLGLAWGAMGSSGGIPNPLGLISERFKTRNTVATGSGGQIGDYFFSGENVGLFGGVEYKTPWRDLHLKVELDANDYQTGYQKGKISPSSPINFGASLRPVEWLETSIGWERGNTFMFNASLLWNLQKNMGMPKVHDSRPLPAPPPRKTVLFALPTLGLSSPTPVPRKTVLFARPTLGLPSPTPVPLTVYRTEKPVPVPDPKISQIKVYRAIIKELTEQDFNVDGVHIDERRVTIFANHRKFLHTPQAIGRAARTVDRHAPAEIEEIRYVHMEHSLKTVQVTLQRSDLERALQVKGSPEEIWEHTKFSGARPELPEGTLLAKNRYPNFNWSIAPKLRQSVGGPDKFYFYQFWLRLSGEVELRRGLFLTGVLGANLYNNFGSFDYTAPSNLPRVRSNIKDYLKEGKNNIVRLQADYLWGIKKDLFARVSGGLFEEMYGGIGGEVLYRPYDKRWAVSLDLNQAQQRDFDQQFSFRDYEITTGHLNFYYQSPYDILTVVRAGKYLAGDIGVTFEISRHFNNGVQIGAFFTRTNVSAEQFGEGSFDKGLMISFPLELFLTKSNKSVQGLAFRPLTRDGGQRLTIQKRLYGITAGRDRGAMNEKWSKFLK